MGKLVKLNAERWVNDLFREGDLAVDMSTKGNVRFRILNDTGVETITLEALQSLGERISAVLRDDEEE